MFGIATKVIRTFEVIRGKDVYAKPDTACKMERLGSAYGGWEIVPGQIKRDVIVYSFGVGEDATFDIALIEKFGVTVHAFDPTPRSIEWVKKQNFPDRFVMHGYGVAGFDGMASFNPPENPEHVSHTLLDRPSTQTRAISVLVKKLGTIMKELGHDRIDVLKMDIEGAEYDVIQDLSRTNIRPDLVLVEFHHRFPGVGTKKTRKAIATIRSMGYGLFSVSAGNEDFCFIRKT